MKGRPYDIFFARVHDLTTNRTVARARCISCDRTDDAPLDSGKGLNCLRYRKQFERRGWRIPSEYSTAGVTCPVCVNAQAVHRKTDTDSEIRKIGPVMSTPVIPEKPSMKLSDLPTEVRSRIRDLLDVNFEIDPGRYVGGYSDQKIGAELNIPWSLVAALREVAYGPITVDPEVERFQGDVAAAMERVAAAEKTYRETLTTAEKAFSSAMSIALNRIAELEATAKKLSARKVA